MGLLLLTVLVLAVLLDYGAFGARWRGIVRRAVRPALLLGGIGFAAGFFGPMLLAPEANQGPLLGIFITGPAGFVSVDGASCPPAPSHRDRSSTSETSCSPASIVCRVASPRRSTSTT